MEFLVKPPALIILKYLNRSNNKAIKGNLKSTLASQVKQIDYVLDSLVSDGYIMIIHAEVSLTEKSINYLKDYDNIGSEYIFKQQGDLAILKFLYEINTPLPVRWFPKIIQDWSPVYAMGNPDKGYDLQTYIVYHSTIKSYVINQNENFSLKPAGRNYYESIIAEKEKESNKENFETQNKMLQSQISELMLESLKYQKENRELLGRVNESQLKINELSLIKKPNWKERHWLIMLALGVAIGVGGDILKEVVIHRMYPEQKEIKNPIQEKKDSVALLPAVVGLVTNNQSTTHNRSFFKESSLKAYCFLKKGTHLSPPLLVL